MASTKYCGYCLEAYTSANKTYCSADCNRKAYDLRQRDPQEWQSLRDTAIELSLEADEAAEEEAMMKWWEDAATRLAGRLAPLFEKHAAPVFIGIGAADRHSIERRTDGSFQTRVYQLEGEWCTAQHDALLEACRALCEPCMWGLFGLSEPDSVELDVLA